MVASVTREQIVTSIRAMLAARKPESSICPSEVARELWPADTWREHMDDVRAVAGELARAGEVTITQGENEVELAVVRGPIRIRRGTQWDETP